MAFFLLLMVGLGLIGFHVGQIGMFGWGFHANAVLQLRALAEVA